MIRLPRPSWAAVPPTIVGVEWSNPITRGLVDVVVPAWGRSLVLGGLRNTTAGLLSIVDGAGRLGSARITTGNTATEEYGPMGAGLTTWTHLGVLRQTATTGTRTAGVGVVNSGGFMFINGSGAFRAIASRSGGNHVLTGLTLDQEPAVMLHTGNPTNHTLRVRDSVVGPTAHGGIVGGTGNWAIGRASVTNTSLAEHFLYAVWSRELSVDEQDSLVSNPWQLLQRPRRLIAVAFDAGAITGASAGTLNAVTGTAAGTVRVAGSSAATLNGVVGSTSGTVRVSGASTGTLSQVAGTATGSVVSGISGVSSATLATVTGSASGAVAVAATSSQTVSGITGSSTGAVVVRAASSDTLGAVIGTATGSVISGIAGASSATLGPVTGSSAGTVSLTGTSAQSVGAVTGSSAGQIVVTGISSRTLDAITGAAAGVVGSAPVLGQSSATLGSVTGSSAGAVGVAGASSAALGAVAGSAVGSVAVRGVSGITLGAVTGSATGSTLGAIAGASVATLGAVTGVAVGTVSDAPIFRDGNPDRWIVPYRARVAHIRPHRG